MAAGAVDAVGQLGLSYSWAQRYGSNVSTRSDYGRGVAVLTDGTGDQSVGTVVSAGEYTGTYNATGGTPSLKAYTTFVTPTIGGGLDTWSRQFKEVNANGGNITANGVAVATPFVEGSLRHAFVGGYFNGYVDFGSGITKTVPAAPAKDAYVARIDRDTQLTDWVTVFSGTGDQECLAVAAGPACAGGNNTAGTSQVRLYTCPLTGASATVIAAGGYFTNQIAFPYFTCNPPWCTPTPSSHGGEDAFLALVYSEPGKDVSGFVFHAITFGSSGNDRITGVAFDQVDQSVYVTGFFSGTDINFDPDYHPALGDLAVGPDAYSGGTDIFVAKYILEPDLEANPGDKDLRLDWVCCKGGSGNDSGAAIAVDSQGYAYATGWMRDAGGTRDLWIARYLRESGCVVPHVGLGIGFAPVENWTYQYAATGDQAGNGIAIDGLGRLLVTGQFAGTMDFDHAVSSTDNRTSAGGSDIFLMRLRRYGQYDGTFTFGSTKDDVGASVAVDPVQSMRVAHAGYFGSPDATNTYTVDFDPSGATHNLTCKGKADGYASCFVPSFATGVQTQTTLVIDNSGSVSDDLGEFDAMIDAYHAAITDATVVPQNGKAALNAIFYGFGEGGYLVYEVMPWTVIDSADTAAIFADQLRNLARGGESNFIDEGLQLAEQSHHRGADMGLDACYHVLSVISDGRNDSELPEQDYPFGRGADDLHDSVFNGFHGYAAVISSAFVDQIDGYAVRGDVGYGGINASRFFFQNYMIVSDVATAAFTLETPDPNSQFSDPIFPSYLKIMLAREAHCPGDYDGNGQVNGTDQTLFNTDWTNHVQKADLNWDGVWDASDQSIYTVLKNIGCCP